MPDQKKYGDAGNRQVRAHFQSGFFSGAVNVVIPVRDGVQREVERESADSGRRRICYTGTQRRAG